MILVSVFPVPLDWDLCYLKEKVGTDPCRTFTDKCEAQLSQSQSNWANQ